MHRLGISIEPSGAEVPQVSLAEVFPHLCDIRDTLMDIEEWAGDDSEDEASVYAAEEAKEHVCPIKLASIEKIAKEVYKDGQRERIKLPMPVVLLEHLNAQARK